MTIQELETQLLSLDATQKRRIIQLLTQSIHSPTPPSPPSIMTLGMFRGPNQSVEGDFTIAEFHGDPDDDLNWTKN